MANLRPLDAGSGNVEEPAEQPVLWRVANRQLSARQPGLIVAREADIGAALADCLQGQVLLADDEVGERFTLAVEHRQAPGFGVLRVHVLDLQFRVTLRLPRLRLEPAQLGQGHQRSLDRLALGGVAVALYQAPAAFVAQDGQRPGAMAYDQLSGFVQAVREAREDLLAMGRRPPVGHLALHGPRRRQGHDEGENGKCGKDAGIHGEAVSPWRAANSGRAVMNRGSAV